MTKQEHEMIFALFVTQVQVAMTIWELLSSRGIVESGDSGPYAALASVQLPGHVGSYFETYSRIAQQCGVELPQGFAPGA